MKKILSVWVTLAATAAFAASCKISNVVWKQNGLGKVTIAYDLSGADGYVMVDILQDGASVSGKGTLAGDVGKYVQVGTGKSVTWTITDETLKRYHAKRGSFSVRITAGPDAPDYMVVELSTGVAAYYADAASVPDGVADGKYKSTHMVLRRIHAGGKTALLGKLLGEQTYGSEQFAPYAVQFTNDYYMAIYETTAGQHQELGGTIPSGYGYASPNAYSGKSHDAAHRTDYLWHPISLVTVGDGLKIASTLKTRFNNNKQNGATFDFDLPTEDEWEYACRAGCPRDLPWGWYGHNYTYWGYAPNDYIVNYQSSRNAEGYYGADASQHLSSVDALPVGCKKPTAWGLYDILGNVDEYAESHTGTYWVRRGGWVQMSGEPMIASYRQMVGNSSTDKGIWIGYRLVCRPTF